MENAVEALKMAFAVIVFSIALTISIMMFTKAKNTSDIVLAAEDETSEYDYYRYDAEELSQKEKRIVGLETVIPTLYKYYKENYTVVFKVGTYNNGNLSNENLELYTSKSPYKTAYGKKLWGDYDWTKYWGNISENNSKIYKICSFDMDEEIKRHEPWSGKQSDTKNNLDLFLNGGTFKSPDNNTSRDMNYGSGFINELKSIAKSNNPKFVEELGEYIYEREDDGSVDSSGGTTITINDETISLLRKNKKRVITYTLLRNS